MRLRELPGLRIGIWGLGREGQAMLSQLRDIAVARPVVLIDERKSPAELLALAQRQDVACEVAPLEDFARLLGRLDVLIKSPGVSLYRKEVVLAQQAGVIVTSGTRLWFADDHDSPIVVVTGTKGKSTTTSLIHHFLVSAGLEATLAGNIGVPLISLSAHGATGVWVVELSSQQLADIDRGPSIGVLTNLFPEHLDWHGTEERYFRDKLSLFRVGPGCTPVLNATDPNTLRYASDLPGAVFFNSPSGFHAKEGAVFDGDNRLVDVDAIPLRGAHNVLNVCAALSAVQLLGIDPTSCTKSVRTFKALPHRLSVLGTVRGITFVDDSISTTPQSAVAALQAFAGRPTTLIVGGLDRGLDYEHLARYCCVAGVEQVLTVPSSGRRIAQSILDTKGPNPEAAPAVRSHESLEGEISDALETTPSGGVVILSPAAPSYDRFKDYQDRGRFFAQRLGLFPASSDPARSS